MNQRIDLESLGAGNNPAGRMHFAVHPSSPTPTRIAIVAPIVILLAALAWFLPEALADSVPAALSRFYVFLLAGLAGALAYRAAQSTTAGPDAQAQVDLWQQRFLRVTELSSYWYWETDREFRVILHTGWDTVHDKLPGEWMGKRPWEVPFVEALLPGGWEEQKSRFTAHQAFNDIEYAVTTADGAVHYSSVSGEPMFGPDGHFRGYRGVGRDITQRKQAKLVAGMEKHLLELRLANAPLEDILTAIRTELEGIVPGTRAVIHLVSSDQRQLSIAAAPDLDPALAMAATIPVDSASGPAGHAASARETVVEHELLRDPLALKLSTAGFEARSAWSGPLFSSDALMGTLTLYSNRATPPSVFELRLLERACRYAAFNVEHARQEDFRQLATSIFANSEDGIIITDADNNIVGVNPAFTQITGYNPEEVEGRNPSILSVGLDGQSFYWGMWDTLTRTGHWQGTVRDRRKDGTTYYKRLTVIAIKNAQGKTTHHAGWFADVTREKEAEQRLRLRHRVTRILSEDDDIATVLRNVSRAICQTLGLDGASFWQPRTESAALVCGSFFCGPDRDQKEFARLLGEISLTPDQFRLAQAWVSGKLLNLPELMRDGAKPVAGAEATGLAQALIQPFMAGDQLLGALAYHGARAIAQPGDLSEIAHSIGIQVETFLIKRRAEAALRASETELRLITDKLPAGIVYYDRSMFCGFANPGYAALYETTVAQTVGRHIEAIVGREEFRDEANFYRRAMQGETLSYQRARRRRSGQTGFIEIRLVPARADDDTISGCYALCRDVTDQVRAEQEIRILNAQLEDRVRERTRQLEAVVRELEAFSYSVSHDLRAPLRAVDGFARILDQKYAAALDETGKGYLDRIRRGSRRMEELIDDMLLLSQVTRGEFVRASVDLSALARTIAEGLAAAAPERQVTVDIEDGMAVLGDQRLLRIALENLLGNAWKFTSKRAQPAIAVGRIATPHGNAIFVRDNGAGFDMRYAHKLFGSFQRLHGASEFEGTGIGLAIVQRVVNRHGGTIWAEAEVDRGATFYLALEPQQLTQDASVNGSPRES